MKTCPYCLEEIKEGARRCKHCQAQLEQSAIDSDQLIYILDRGLIRFGKFAGAILAIFIVFGVYVFGFDLKELVEEMGEKEEELEEIAERLEESKTLLAEAQVDLNDAHAAAESTREEAFRIVTEAREKLAEIRGYRSDAADYVSEMRELNPTEERVLRRTKTALNLQREGKLWPVEATLRIRFLDGTAPQHLTFEQAARRWAQFANITLQFSSSDTDAQIRVSFEHPGSWAYVGTDALVIPDTQPTINIGAADEDGYAVLHEFGHVLGLVHELQNPSAGIEWNKEVVYDEMGESFQWSKELVDRNMFASLPEEDYPGQRPFDRHSIMIHGTIPAHWHANEAPIGPNTKLSQSDKVYISQLYP